MSFLCFVPNWVGSRLQNYKTGKRQNRGNHAVFNDFSGCAGATSGPLPPPKTMKTYMFPMILGIGRGLPSPPTSPKTMEVMMFSMILEAGPWPRLAFTSLKKHRNLNVSNHILGTCMLAYPPAPHFPQSLVWHQITFSWSNEHS